MEYLRDKQEYVDLYDRFTVDRCRRIEESFKEKELTPIKDKRMNKKEMLRVTVAASELMLYFIKGDEYARKERTIQEWMERDREKDELLESAQAPENIRCLTCQKIMEPTYKDIYDLYEGPTRVLFMYDCPDEHLPRRAFYDDGEERIPKPPLCPKCNSKLKTDDKRKGNVITTTEICTNCSYKNVDKLELTSEKKKEDKNFAKDRARFCLSEKEGQEYIRSKATMEEIKKFMAKHKEKEKNKETYDKVDQLQKLTVVQLQELLEPVFEKAGYTKLQFGEPDMGKDLYLPFTTYDTKPDRKDRESSYELQKVAKKALEPTNWRLMSDGISYRSGILTGRLRAYEREEDLVKLVTKKKKRV